MSLDRIKQPIATELDIFEARFRDAMRSQVPLLDKITWYIVQRKGKQVRPMLVLLSARLFAPINEASYTAASLVELLHTATLVHDDVAIILDEGIDLPLAGKRLHQSDVDLAAGLGDEAFDGCNT